MRFIITAAAGVALALTLAAGAQAQNAQQPQAGQSAGQSQSPAGGAGAKNVRSVNVVAFEELPPESKRQVDDISKKTSESDLRGMRNSIDKSPQIKKVLDSRGAKSSDVIVANLAQDGALTLVTRKRG
jgi:hypothetical protein